MFPILIATFFGGCALGAFAVLVVGIHIEEHRRGTRLAHGVTPSELAARQVMGVYVRKPSRTRDAQEEGK